MALMCVFFMFLDLSLFQTDADGPTTRGGIIHQLIMLQFMDMCSLGFFFTTHLSQFHLGDCHQYSLDFCFSVYRLCLL